MAMAYVPLPSGVRYEVRRSGPGEGRPRWVIHRAGFPFDIQGGALTKAGAMRVALRWVRAEDKAGRSYPVG
jgi:hypothetical protein